MLLRESHIIWLSRLRNENHIFLISVLLRESLTSQQPLGSLVIIHNCPYSSSIIPISSHMTSSSILRRARRKCISGTSKFSTEAGFKCVHSHPLHAWDHWVWNESHLYGIEKGAAFKKLNVASGIIWQVTVLHTVSIHSRFCGSREEYVGPFVQWEAWEKTQSLSPTSATNYHNVSVYYQVK